MSDESSEVRFKDRWFNVYDGAVHVPVDAVIGPKADPDFEWLRSDPLVEDGIHVDGLPFKLVPLDIWDRRIAPSGTPL